jgi:hypothetical protein
MYESTNGYKCRSFITLFHGSIVLQNRDFSDLKVKLQNPRENAAAIIPTVRFSRSPDEFTGFTG